jgi:putative tryptophan/tyrosine transport system substrate-binding protein
MRRRTFVVGLGILFLTTFRLARAQQPSTKIPRIGYIMTRFLDPVRSEALRQGLRELGYVEGKNIIIDWRSAEGKLDRLPGIVAELVRLNVDVIVTGGPLPTRVTKDATPTIPIVMTQVNDPVGNGFVASLARPGGNITGLSSLAPEISGKQLELLKEILPSLSRVAVFGTSTQPGNSLVLKEVELTAGALAVKLQYVDILVQADIESAFGAAVKGRAHAILMIASSSVVGDRRQEFVDLAVKSRLPVVYPFSSYVEAGGLMFYGANLTDLDRRAATFVDKILKGAKPADLPVEQPTKFELVINLKTAKVLGLKIPAHLLMETNRVIE